MNVTTYNINKFYLFSDDYEAHRTISKHTNQSSRFLLLRNLIHVISNKENPLALLAPDSVSFLKSTVYEFNIGDRFLVKVNPTERLMHTKYRTLTRNIDEWVKRKFMDTAVINSVRYVGKQRYLNKNAIHIAYFLYGVVTQSSFNQLSQNGIGTAKGFGFGSPIHVD
ncbi:hypothetical protein [Leptospira santarosai]|uniref:hypothetical protein n=1 Tax=Leptospira santarosai TaxID=28183 RepID=UPI0026E29904|nr:hypothetical protein [Leptospira santarosai]MDO6383437.1 hypothetical protein [Leptospira santarosai]